MVNTSMATNTEAPTAAIIAIGNSLLTGVRSDLNSPYLSKQLWALGVEVRKICIVPDDVDVIAHDVADFSSRYTYVFTTGGLGATADDVTMLGIAKAFSEDLVVSPSLRSSVVAQESSGVPENMAPAAYDKLASVPSSAKLMYPESGGYPLVAVKNVMAYIFCFFEIIVHHCWFKNLTPCILATVKVYIFPGPYSVVKQKFESARHLFMHTPALERMVLVTSDEKEIAGFFAAVRSRHSTVRFRSFPKDGPHEAKIVLVARKCSDLENAYNDLIASLPKGSFQTLGDVRNGDNVGAMLLPSPTGTAQDAHLRGATFEFVGEAATDFDPLEDVNRVLQEKLPGAEKIRETMGIIREALERYGLDQVALSFNGGKDCTVLLHLLYAARQEYVRDHPDEAAAALSPIKTLYVTHANPFPEVDDFVDFAVPRYKLDIMKIYGPMKQSLRIFLEKSPNVKAILIGIRRTDPFGENLQSFQTTDPGWPQIMRVNPILDWDYADIWDALGSMRVPYCILYDYGYTSLGGTDNTLPNPSLANPARSCGHDPAYKLRDAASERDGRITRR
ncbi:FAD1 flavin adenine dinucleotide synthetase [Borealophlyctis nickersoniae]|nr:FAD1 flavin adenine dinucleotide synthetase [Borealophlyctis nickersoniae]